MYQKPPPLLLLFLHVDGHALPGGSCDCRQYQGKFVRAVDQVLRSFQGRNLRSFKVKPWVLRVANFCKVTELCLIHGEASQFGIVNMNRILRAFPCLQELEFRQAVSPDLEEEKAELKEYVHRRLRRVVMAGFHGTPSEIGCVIYLLTHTTVLERLVINPKFSTRHPWHIWVADISLNKEEREKICERLKPFCKDGVLTVH